MKHSPSPLRWGLATLVVVAVAVSLATAGPASKEVVLRAVDGVGIAATYYPPKSPGQKPSVILRQFPSIAIITLRFQTNGFRL